MTISITIDLTDDELKKVEKIQQQHGLSSLQEAVEMLCKMRLENVRYQLTGDIGQPTWVEK